MEEQKSLYERFLAFLKGKETILAEDKELKKILWTLNKLTDQEILPDKERMWEQICTQISISSKHSFKRWRKVAAVLLPALLGGVFLYYSQMTNSKQEPVLTAISRDQVQLFLPGDQVVNVQQIATDSLLQEEGAEIWFDTTNLMVYTPKEQVMEKPVYNVLNVPRCCEYHIILADGTEVWLNSESELRFPIRFVGKERRVFLKGEAYFQVAQNTAKPFRVEAQGMEVEALGTAFDVNVYRDAGKLSTTLLNGAVRVTDLISSQSCVLQPGEQAILKDCVLSTIKVNAQEIIAWKEGRFVFSNMAMKEIAQQLKRWYDVEVEFCDELLRYDRFTGVIKRDYELSCLIRMIEETTDIKFQLEGKKLKVYR